MPELELTPLQELWAYFGNGLYLLLLLMGVLGLILPGRFWPLLAREHGLGRQVEALLILGVVAGSQTLGLGSIPIWIDSNSLVSFSLVGALIPTILSIHFLIQARAAGLVALVGVAATAVASYYTSRPLEGYGIVSLFPDMFLPAIVAAACGTLIGRTIAAHPFHAVGISYAAGSLGALIGADLVRFEYVLTIGAGTVGGAEDADLVFLEGVWAAGLASLSLIPLYRRLGRDAGPWDEVARRAREGRAWEGLQLAHQLTVQAMEEWGRRRGLVALPAEELRRVSFAGPALARAEQAMAYRSTQEEVFEILEDLERLGRRLSKPVYPEPASRGRRLGAGAIDLLVPLAVGVGAFSLGLQAMTGGGATRGLTLVFSLLFALSWTITAHVLYNFLAEWLTNGLTLGKKVAGLRVRSLVGDRLTGWQALVRNLGRLMDMPMFYLVTFLNNPASGRQRLGDYFAETVVTYDRPNQAHNAMAEVTSPTPIAAPAMSGTLDVARRPR